MSAFWLGVFVGLMAWKLVNSFLAFYLASAEKTTEWDHTNVVSEMFQTLLFAVAAVLTHAGLIL